MSKERGRKVIITCAITGAIHTPTMSEHLPCTPEDIADQAVEAAEAGAAILHLHARDPIDGRPTPAAATYMQFLPAIRERCDAVVNLTTGGSMMMSLDERMEGPLLAEPEMCSLNMGTMNFGIFPLAARYPVWKHDWEKPYLLGSAKTAFRNTFDDIEQIMTRLGADGARFEHECYDVGHLYTLAHFADRGIAKPPFFIQFVLGILGGIGADPRALLFLKETADRLFGDDFEWSVLGAGRAQMEFAAQAALLGGNVRVGLEDSLYIERGRLASTNAQQVRKVRSILVGLGFEIATPAEARARLHLKGAAGVAF